MKFYAYKPTKEGKEPLGSMNCILFELKTIRGAKARAKRNFKDNFKLFSYTNFYDDKTFKEIL